MSTALVQVDPARRSVSHYKPATGDPWPVIAAWAQLHRFQPRALETPSDDVKLYQKGNGLLTAPMRAQFTRTGDTMEVQVWIHIPLISRIFALFLLPAEMNVASGGFRAVIPRNMARRAINELLTGVGGQPIA